MNQTTDEEERELAEIRDELETTAARLVLRAREGQRSAKGCFHRSETMREDGPGWSFVLSTHRHDGIEHWHLSARLQPLGRGSRRFDWRVLGFFVAEVQERSGYPEHFEPPEPLTPLETTHPNLAHHWVWHSDGSPLDPCIQEALRVILGGARGEGQT